MKRNFEKLLWADIRFAWRHGFYFVYILLTAAYVLLIKNIPVTVGRIVSPLLIYGDPSIVGMFFMGAIVLLERQQGILDYMMVTPLSNHTYMLSKVISMTMVSIFAGCLIMALTVGFQVAWGWFIIGMVLTSIVHTLLGIMIALRCTTLNELIMLSIPFIFIETLPVATMFDVPYTGFARFLPGYYGVNLIYGSVHGVQGGVALLNLLLLALWCILLWFITQRVLNRVMTGRRGR